MKNLSELQNEELNKGQKILLFSANWCKDCVALESYINDVINANTQWEFVYIDVDQFGEISESYNIFGIPSFVAQIDGKVVSELISKEHKSESLINSWIKTIGKI